MARSGYWGRNRKAQERCSVCHAHWTFRRIEHRERPRNGTGHHRRSASNVGALETAEQYGTPRVVASMGRTFATYGVEPEHHKDLGRCYSTVDRCARLGAYVRRVCMPTDSWRHGICGWDIANGHCVGIELSRVVESLLWRAGHGGTVRRSSNSYYAAHCFEESWVYRYHHPWSATKLKYRTVHPFYWK